MLIQSHSVQDTEALAADIAKTLRKGDILLLSGPLGAGKSVFARALIRALTQKPNQNVPSPTFTLVQLYDTEPALIRHFDLYRLQREDEIFELGWEEDLITAITIVEWPERLGNLIPAYALDITIKASHNDENIREILIEDKRGHEPNQFTHP